MNTSRRKHLVRRSVALPQALVDELDGLIGPGHAENWNRLVIHALEEYAADRRRSEFEEAMTAMAADPDIRSETKRIAREFKKTERDGL